MHGGAGKIEGGFEFTFDFLMLCVVAAMISCIGLATNNDVIIVASMLVSPLMGPIMAITFGTVISDKIFILEGLKTERVRCHVIDTSLPRHPASRRSECAATSLTRHCHVILEGPHRRKRAWPSVPCTIARPRPSPAPLSIRRRPSHDGLYAGSVGSVQLQRTLSHPVPASALESNASRGVALRVTMTWSVTWSVTWSMTWSMTWSKNMVVH